MNQTLESHVKTAFDEILGHAPQIGETPMVEVAYLSSGGPQGGSRMWIGIAAATTALVGVGGLLAVTSRSSEPTAGIGTSQSAPATAEEELARVVAKAASEVGWTIAVPADLTASQAHTNGANIKFAEVRLRMHDGSQLLVSIRTGDAEAVAAGTAHRDGLLRKVGSANVYIGTDSSSARALELFDGTTIVYVRSESTSEAATLDDLTTIAVALNNTWAPDRLNFGAASAETPPTQST